MIKQKKIHQVVLVLMPCLIWLVLLKVNTPWWLENTLSTPLVLLVILLILLLFITKYVSKLQAAAYFIINLCLALFINNIQISDDGNINLEKIAYGCNNSLKFFQFNMKFNSNEDDIDKLTAYLIKENFELITLQGVPQQSKKPLIEKLNYYYPFYIIGENKQKRLITDQIVFSLHAFENVNYHEIKSGSPLISSDWLIPRTDSDKIGELRTINLYTLHPPSPRNKKLWETRNTVLNQLNEAIKKQKVIHENHKKTIVMGDLNLPRHSERIDDIKNLMHTKHINSWPNHTYLSTWFGLAIDHFWISKSAYICSRNRVDMFYGSDHYAIKTRVFIDNINI